MQKRLVAASLFTEWTQSGRVACTRPPEWKDIRDGDHAPERIRRRGTAGAIMQSSQGRVGGRCAARRVPKSWRCRESSGPGGSLLRITD